MGRLSRVAAVTGNTFRETIRQRVLYNLVFFAILMMFSGLLMKQLSIRQDEKIIKDLGLAAMDVFGTVIAVFIGVALISREIERRSLFPLLAKPLTRNEFILGKFLGLALVLLVNVGVMTAGLYGTLLATGRPFDPGLVKAIYALYLSLLLAVAIALLFSTMTSSALAALCTICAVVAGRYSDVVKGMKQVAPGAPQWVIDVVYFVLPNFHNFDLKNQVVYGEAVPLAVLGWITAYAAVYLGVLLGGTLLLFRKRDFL